MAKIDEIKAHIDWLKELFKILVTILVADIAGISKLYLDGDINLLFYSGVVLVIVLSISASITSKKIEKHIKELGDL
ncbi:MAG: hypothetical protein PHQ93_01795 [Sulfurimonas sp.]|uniref:hypothetical protein n=1 Tax=Sulfurimonas sp. TaxID=2022749 RepID=UPI0026237666|nr:hypothetical protein [Sulfurimonas sp.]MDD5399908.1 hypothetical protein [Sulfurimonas sp.]